MLQPSADVVYRRLGDTAVLVHLGTSEIFELNDTGARIWELVVEGRSIDGVVELIVGEFDVDTSTVRAECDTLLNALAARQLIQIT